jgi:hypothetical protein
MRSIALATVLAGSLASPAFSVSSPDTASRASSPASNASSATASVAHRSGGRQINANQVAWEGGRVIATLPAVPEGRALGPGEKVAALGVANCPLGWSCLYEHRDFNGVRVQFR